MNLIGLLLGFLRLLSELSSFGDNAGLVGVLSGLLGGVAELKEEGASEQPAQDADEARIVAEAAKLGEKSEKAGEDILDILLSLGVDNWGLLFFGHCCELYAETISEQKTPVVNAEAEKDVQNVLAELKEEGASEQPAQDLGVDNWGLLFFGHCCELYAETISVRKKKMISRKGIVHTSQHYP
jgi:hypothetical protein